MLRSRTLRSALMGVTSEHRLSIFGCRAESVAFDHWPLPHGRLFTMFGTASAQLRAAGGGFAEFEDLLDQRIV